MFSSRRRQLLGSAALLGLTAGLQDLLAPTRTVGAGEATSSAPTATINTGGGTAMAQEQEQPQAWFARAIGSGEFQWTQTPYGYTTVLWGDPNSGPYATLNRFPAGTVIPLHTHTNDGYVVVIQGILFNYRPGEAKAPYGPGSLLSEPGGVPHVTEAGPDSECIVFATQNRALDFNLP